MEEVKKCSALMVSRCQSSQQETCYPKPTVNHWGENHAKLLFIQARRGDQEDQGVDVLTNLTNTCASPSPRLSPPSACPDSPTEQTEAPTLEKKIIAGQRYFLTAYSTVDGYVLYRFADIGSHFVRALVDVSREHVSSDHLVNLLIEVNKRAGDMESVDKGRKFKQSPPFETTLVKQLWF